MAEHYQSKHSAPATAKEKSKLPIIIVCLILGFCIVGAGVYALVHFVLLPQPEVTPTEIPTQVQPSLSPIPTEAPTQAATEPDYAAMADAKLAQMTDREKICQLMIVSPDVLTGVDGATMAGDTTKKAIEDYPVGGIIYFSDNFEDLDQTKEMIAKSQQYAKTPMFISVDEEGGEVSRVADKLGTKKFEPMFTYKDKGEQTAHDNAEVIASNLRAIGFNLDYAPVADVWSNPDNTVIGQRAYSDKADEASKLVAGAVGGFKDGGVLCTLKHFPGHGDTSEDSHEGQAYVSSTEEELKSGALLPFKSGIEAGADMVMVGHLTVTNIDPEMPASLSSKVVPQLLREYLGYDGIVITDAMNMGAITNNFSTDAIIKGIFDADVDIILCPDNLDNYITAFETALENGTITQAQIDAKVKKILTLKYSKGIIEKTDTAPTEAPSANPSESSTDAAVAETAAINDPTAAAP